MDNHFHIHFHILLEVPPMVVCSAIAPGVL